MDSTQRRKLCAYQSNAQILSRTCRVTGHNTQANSSESSYASMQKTLSTALLTLYSRPSLSNARAKYLENFYQSIDRNTFHCPERLRRRAFTAVCSRRAKRRAHFLKNSLNNLTASDKQSVYSSTNGRRKLLLRHRRMSEVDHRWVVQRKLILALRCALVCYDPLCLQSLLSCSNVCTETDDKYIYFVHNVHQSCPIRGSRAPRGF